MLLRRTDPERPRHFRVPALWLVGPLAIGGCIFLFLNLPTPAMLMLPIWTVIGIVIYGLYGYRKSHLGKGRVEVHEVEIEEIEPPVPATE